MQLKRGMLYMFLECILSNTVLGLRPHCHCLSHLISLVKSHVETGKHPNYTLYSREVAVFGSAEFRFHLI